MALEAARQLRLHLDPGRVHKGSHAAASGLLFREAVELWQVDEELRVRTLKKKASTLVIQRYRCRPLVEFFGNDDIASLTEHRLAQYQAWRLDQGRTPETINTDVRVLSLILRWTVRHGLIPDVPKVEPIPQRPKPSVIPTPHEVVQIIHGLPCYLQPLVRFLAETGCRKGEAINLIWDCVDEVEGYVEINAREGWTPKTQQSERRIPLNDALLALIRSLPKTGQYVFAGQSGDAPIGDFRKAWRTAVAKVDMQRRGKQVHIPVKALRKAHATWQAERGVQESVLQELLGHARGSSVTRKHYVEVSERAKRRAVIELPFGEREGNECAPNLATSGNSERNTAA
jgi:integrase